MSRYYVVEQVGDCTFRVPGSYPCEATAMLAAVNLTIASDEEREYFVDGPDLNNPIGVGRSETDTDRQDTKESPE